jgi:hypothetical protein
MPFINLVFDVPRGLKVRLFRGDDEVRADTLQVMFQEAADEKPE